MRLLAFLLFVLSGNLLVGQSLPIDSVYRDGSREIGLKIAVDDSLNVYTLSEVGNPGNPFKCRLRKISSDGEAEFFTDILNLSNGLMTARDVLITEDERIVSMCLDSGNPSPPNRPGPSLLINTFTLSGTPIDTTRIFLNPQTFASGNAAAHLRELSDGSFALISDVLAGISWGERIAMVSHLSPDFEVLLSMPLASVKIQRLRAFEVVENDYLAIGSNDVFGAAATKVDIKDSTVLWSKSYGSDSTKRFVTTYGFKLLPDSSSYGLVANNIFTNSSLDGIYYFQLDLDGNELARSFFPEGNASRAFPRLHLGPNGRIFIFYNFSDTTDILPIRQLEIRPDGELLQDGLFSSEISSFALREYTPYDANYVAGIGNGGSRNFMGTGTQVITIPYLPLLTTNTQTTLGDPFGVVVYPNPSTSGKLHIRMPQIAPGKLTLMIYDLSGRELMRSSLSAGNMTYTLNLPDLKSGTYFLRLISGTRSSTRKFTVIR